MTERQDFGVVYKNKNAGNSTRYLYYTYDDNDVIYYGKTADAAIENRNRKRIDPALNQKFSSPSATPPPASPPPVKEEKNIKIFYVYINKKDRDGARIYKYETGKNQEEWDEKKWEKLDHIYFGVNYIYPNEAGTRLIYSGSKIEKENYRNHIDGIISSQKTYYNTLNEQYYILDFRNPTFRIFYINFGTLIYSNDGNKHMDITRSEDSEEVENFISYCKTHFDGRIFDTTNFANAKIVFPDAEEIEKGGGRKSKKTTKRKSKKYKKSRKSRK